MKLRLFPLFIFLLFASTVQAQQTINNPDFGFSFDLPAGWQVANFQGSYLINSNYQKGLIIVGKEPAKSIAEIKQNMLVPYSEGATSLSSNGQIEELGNNIYGTKINGTLDGTPCEAYIIDVLVPSTAVASIMVAVEENSYSDDFKQIALKIAQSVNNPLGNHSNSIQQQSSSTELSGIGDAASLFAGYALVWMQVGSEYERAKVQMEFCSNGNFIGYEMSGYTVGSAADMGEATMQGQWRLDKQGQNYKLTTIDAQGNRGETLVYPFVDEYGDQRFRIGGKAFGYYGESRSCN